MTTEPQPSADTIFINKKWKRNKIVWFYGLASATVLGISHSITPMIVAPETFNFNGGLKKLGIVAMVSGLLGAMTYLSKSPLPALPKELLNEESKSDSSSGNNG